MNLLNQPSSRDNRLSWLVPQRSRHVSPWTADESSELDFPQYTVEKCVCESWFRTGRVQIDGGPLGLDPASLTNRRENFNDFHLNYLFLKIIMASSVGYAYHRTSLPQT